MIVRQDFTQLPPKPFMLQVADPLVKTYVFLWDQKDETNKISMTWKDLTRYYNKNAFRTNMRKLNEHGLISYTESDNGISIEVTGWDECVEED